MIRPVQSISRGAISLLFLAFIASAIEIGEECRIDQKTRIACRCSDDEEFLLPEGYNYENVTSLRLASCAFANLHFSSLTEAKRIEEIIVRNISERLNFELFVTSKRIKRLELSGIGRIPIVTHDTFLSLRNIDVLRIEDTHIEIFEEQFTDIAVTNLSIVNSTIERIDGLNFSGKGGSLLITASKLRNVTGTLNLAHFSTVEILESTFEFRSPGHLSIEGDLVLVRDTVFTNASVNLVAASTITMNSTCADGKSSLRLSSERIDSRNNRLPTEIVYTGGKIGDSRYFLNRNNTVCIAGNCKCPKSSGQSTLRRFIPTLVLYLLLSRCL